MVLFLELHNMQGLALMVRLDQIMAMNQTTANVTIAGENGTPDEKKTVECTQIVLCYGATLVAQESIEKVCLIYHEEMTKLQNKSKLAVPPGIQL